MLDGQHVDRIRRLAWPVACNALQAHFQVEEIDLDRIVGKCIWMNIHTTNPVNNAAFVLPA